MKEGTMDLNKFADGNPISPGVKSWWSQLPQETRDEVLAGYRSGIPKSTIVDWLQGNGHPEATINKLQTGLKSE
jgi:hypothetical protein